MLRRIGTDKRASIREPFTRNSEVSITLAAIATINPLYYHHFPLQSPNTPNIFSTIPITYNRSPLRRSPFRAKTMM